MNIGILDFRYGHNIRFAENLRKKGSYSINLGDWVQTLAVHRLVSSLGVADEDIVRIDRDSLPAYQGPPVRLVMNAAFLDHSFPLPPAIKPIFVGFQTSSRDLIKKNWEYFKKYEPIGCRDNDTKSLFTQQGIDAFTTGCLSITLPKRTRLSTHPKPFFISGEGNGAMPKRLKRFVPPDILRAAVYKHQRKQATTLPLSDAEAMEAEASAVALLDSYRDEAGLVITPLLHAATPCLAMGIPVIIVRNDFRDRFTAIERLVPVYTPDELETIDWTPQALELEPLKKSLTNIVNRGLAGDRFTDEMQREVESLHAIRPPSTIRLDRKKKHTHAFRLRIPFLSR
jgi:hypothetical protein